MSHPNGRRLGIGGALAVALALACTGPAFAASELRVVKIEDDCEAVSFNLAQGEETCVGNGDTEFDEFLEEYRDERRVEEWKFSRTNFEVKLGGTLRIVNRGGLYHTFTEVPRFGRGCNELFTNAPEHCELIGDTFVAPGGSLTISDLGVGVHRFQNVIYPWMRAIVRVKR